MRSGNCAVSGAARPARGDWRRAGTFAPTGRPAGRVSLVVVLAQRGSDGGRQQPVVDSVPAQTRQRYRRLRVLNVLAGVLLAAEAAFMLVASNNLALPVTASYLRNDPVAVTGPTVPQVVFLLRIGPAVAFFLALAALDHLLVAAPSVHRWYERGLARRANYARWIEYSISASVMIVLIGLFVGIRDLAAVVAIFTANTAMILFGLLMERQQRPGAADWSAFWFGSLVGVVPWVLIAVYVAQPAQVPGVCLCHHHRPVRAVLQLRGQHGAAVRAGRALARLPPRRGRLHRLEPHRQITARLAHLRQRLAYLGAVGCDPSGAAQREVKAAGYMDRAWDTTRRFQPGWKTGRSGGVAVQIAYRTSRASRPSTETTAGGTVICLESMTRRCSHCPPATTSTNEVMSAHKIGPVPRAPVQV